MKLLKGTNDNIVSISQLLNNKYSLEVTLKDGENIGGTMKIIDKAIKEKGLKLNCGYSISMPYNYIVMGEVDSKDVENKKIQASKETVNEILSVIKNKEDNVFKLTKGFMGPLLTVLVSPMFAKYGTDPSKFYAEDSCFGCGLYEKVCNCNSIKLVDKRPVWGKGYIQCVAFILCPKKAIQYGEGTTKKGRYENPYFKIVN